jgi:hypothetical protein
VERNSTLQQEIFVEIVVFCRANVVSGEGATRFLGLQERDNQNVRSPSAGTPYEVRSNHAHIVN